MTTETDVSRGLVADTLLAVVSTTRADLIVLTSHGRTGFHRWALGSVAEKIARHGPVPVLILREPIHTMLTSSASEQLARPLRVLVPLDGSPLAETALAPAAQVLAALAPPTDRMLHLTRVVDVVRMGGQSLPGMIAEGSAWLEAEEYLAATAERLRTGEFAPLHLQVTWSWTAHIDEAYGIVEVAETGMKMEGTSLPGGCDLIAMATHGRHGIQRWALGSVADHVLHGTRLPLLIVRPGETEPREHQQTRPQREPSQPSSPPHTAPPSPPEPKE
jgi:nucleotide-binding universal stress UspA family protein